jgi:hypothetical protein
VPRFAFSGTVLQIPLPGAPRSTVVPPKLENDARAPLLVSAATATTLALVYAAG